MIESKSSGRRTLTPDPSPRSPSRPPGRGAPPPPSLKIPLLVLVSAATLIFLLQLGCGSGGQGQGQGGAKVVVLGIDGMDYSLTKQFMDAGIMPNFSRLAAQGHFSSLETSVPPLSPVAWSNFITGMDSGGHGIFDFLHRDPDTIIPYLSTSRAENEEPTSLWGCWQIPGAGSVEQLRRGTPFWEVLERHGVETTIVRMPANFPPSGTASRELSGMGTPDLVGTYGTFSFYTSELFAFGGQDVTGGEVYEAWPEDGVVQATLYGPPNPFVSDHDGCRGEKLTLDFSVYLDPEEDVAKLVVGDEERVLKVGEWGGWLPVELEMIPTQTVRGMTRFYLRQVRPEFELYAAPINFDPTAPAMPISTPDDYAAELAEASGMFYTQGMPEDTKALTEEVFRSEDFVAQARLAGKEIAEQYRHVLAEFQERATPRFLFYYFGNLDQISHVMYRPIDPDHPAYDPAVDAPFGTVVEQLYREADEIIGYTLDNLEEGARLIIMSDHGFAPWRRAFNLNTWLKDNGYLVLRNPRSKNELFTGTDWSQTRAYGVGFNGLYLNLEGREKRGIVTAAERDALLDEIKAKLLAELDPATGTAAITKVYRSDEHYQDRGHLDIGPDLQVGYARGTKLAGESTLGEITQEVIFDNTDQWSGDHSMDHETVPGILLTDQPLAKPATSLRNLAASILAEFGIEEEFPGSEG